MAASADIPRGPDYQKAAVDAYFSSSILFFPPTYWNASNRGVPDVAMFAVGTAVMVGGELHDYGGVAAPLFAVLVSLLNEVSLKSSGRPLGFLNPLLYRMEATVPGAFRDITVGDNAQTYACLSSGCGKTFPCGFEGGVGFTAAASWEAVTALGSP